ncbi:dual specificity phosphatase, catalytic domain protein, partial [Teladorsagia circumcincta]
KKFSALRIEPAGAPPSTDKRQVFPVKILPHLLLGNYETASDAKLLERNNARYIINVTSNLPNTFEDNPAYHYLRISVDDNSSHNLSQYFPEYNIGIEGVVDRNSLKSTNRIDQREKSTSFSKLTIMAVYSAPSTNGVLTEAIFSIVWEVQGQVFQSCAAPLVVIPLAEYEETTTFSADPLVISKAWAWKMIHPSR